MFLEYCILQLLDRCQTQHSDFNFTDTIDNKYAYEVCKEILFMSDDLTLVY